VENLRGLMYIIPIFFYMDRTANWDSTAAGFCLALDGTTGAPTLRVWKHEQGTTAWAAASWSTGGYFY